jgi:hypothetical protein
MSVLSTEISDTGSGKRADEVAKAAPVVELPFKGAVDRRAGARVVQREEHQATPVARAGHSVAEPRTVGPELFERGEGGGPERDNHRRADVGDGCRQPGCAGTDFIA